MASVHAVPAWADEPKRPFRPRKLSFFENGKLRYNYMERIEIKRIVSSSSYGIKDLRK
jgi:hypothetical protein